MKKIIIGTTIGAITVLIVLLIVNLIGEKTKLGGIYPSGPTFATTTQKFVAIGPSNSVEVATSTGNRIYMEIRTFDLGDSCNYAFLSLEDNETARINDGVVLVATSTDTTGRRTEYIIDSDNLYTGGIQAITTCAASSTLEIIEAKKS